MSTKHFIALAAIFAGDLACCANDGERYRVRGIILSTADMCKRFNSNFKRDTFYTASGLNADGSLKS